MNDLLKIINSILENKNKKQIREINSATRLRDDIGFDSLDLAELTVHIEAEYGVDVFEDGLVNTVGEVMQKLNHKG